MVSVILFGSLLIDRVVCTLSVSACCCAVLSMCPYVSQCLFDSFMHASTCASASVSIACIQCYHYFDVSIRLSICGSVKLLDNLPTNGITKHEPIAIAIQSAYV